MEATCVAARWNEDFRCMVSALLLLRRASPFFGRGLCEIRNTRRANDVPADTDESLASLPDSRDLPVTAVVDSRQNF